MNNAVIAVAIGIIIIVLGFLIISTMNDEAIVIPLNVNTTMNSSSTAQMESQRREAEFQAKRQENEAKEVAFTIDVTKLPEAQRLSLRTMGINETSIDITNGMMACANAEINEVRMAEIRNGAAITMGEGIKLISCYNDNSL